MSRTEFNISNLSDLLKCLDSAEKDHNEFSKFVRDAEVFCQNEKRDGAVSINLARYREIWLDLEVINALALDDWESSGMPDNWTSQWDETYKHDAQEVMAELRVLLAAL